MIDLTTRAIVKAVKTEISQSIHEGRTLDAERRKRLQFILEDVASTSEDDRARLNAAKELLKLDWEVYQHENPAVQKSEVTHNFPNKIEISILNGKTGNIDGTSSQNTDSE